MAGRSPRQKAKNDARQQLCYSTRWFTLTAKYADTFETYMQSMTQNQTYRSDLSTQALPVRHNTHCMTRKSEILIFVLLLHIKYFAYCGTLRGVCLSDLQPVHLGVVAC